MEQITKEYTGINHKPWLSVRITRVGGSKFVDILSTIHVAKSTRLTVSYSVDFSDYDILRDDYVIKELRRFS